MYLIVLGLCQELGKLGLRSWQASIVVSQVPKYPLESITIPINEVPAWHT